MPTTPAAASLPADWIFVCSGTATPHQLDTLTPDPGGTFSGSGHFVANPAYTWNLTGQQTGTSVTWTVTYTGLEAGFVYTGAGVVGSDGALQSSVDGNVNGCTEVSTSGGLFR